MNPKKKVKPLDIYVRVSRVGGREGESFISPGVQEEQCRAMATVGGYTVGKVFTDLDHSGRKMSRPEFDKAKARVQAGTSGGIIVAKLDRFARNTEGLLKDVREIKEAGGEFVCVSPTINTGDPAFGQFLLTLFGGLAELESNKIADGWSIACARAGERGVHVAQAPTGYKQGDDGRLEINGHAETVRTLFKRRARGESLADLTRWFNAEGVPTRSGNPWSAEGVRQILRNRAYLGEASAGGMSYPDSHPPLVDLPTFLACQKLLGTRRAYGRNSHGPLLGGIIRCTCGSKMSRTYTVVGGKRYDFYQCKGNQQCKADGTAASVSARLIEPLVTEMALGLLGGVQYTYSTDGGSTAEDLASTLQAADAEIAAYIEHTPSATPGYKAGLEKRMAAKVEAEQALAGTASETERIYLDAAKVAADFAEMTVADQRKILGAVVETITVKKGRAPMEERVRITFYGFDPEEISYPPSGAAVNLVDEYEKWERARAA
jgi:DNA invertase Pin-like site-specific DNA recombinase